MEAIPVNARLKDPRKTMKTWVRTAVKNVQAAKDRMKATSALFADCESKEKAEAAGVAVQLLDEAEHLLRSFYHNV